MNDCPYSPLGKEPAASPEAFGDTHLMGWGLILILRDAKKLFTTNQGLLWLSILFLLALVVVKFVASLYTGSMGIRADAIHSLIDISGAVTAIIGIRVASRPVDETREYRHLSAENIAALFISLLIIAGGVWITYGAISRIVNGQPLAMLPLGIYVTSAAIVVNAGIAGLAIRRSKRSTSAALEAHGYHMFTDMLSSVAVLIGLILVRVTGVIILDSVVALIVAVIILRTGWKFMRKSLGELIDARLPESEEASVRDVVNLHSEKIVGINALRSRRSGGRSYIDLELECPRWLDVAQTHHICDQLEAEISARIQGSQVSIHWEPCPAPDSGGCHPSCPTINVCTARKLLDSW